MMNNPQENQQAQHYQNHWWEVELARKEQHIVELEEQLEAFKAMSKRILDMHMKEMEEICVLKERIAELEARNKELMCAMREWYEDGFNRGDCGELIVKHGGEA